MDPLDPRLSSPFEHNAFLDTQVEWAEQWRSGVCLDTGLRCVCGRELTADDESESGWAHVGTGDASDLAGMSEWLEVSQ